MEKLYRDRDWLYEQYVVQKKSTHKIPEEAGCSYGTIWNWLHKFGIPMRDNGYGKSLEERFWAKVDKKGPDECWEWMAARQSNGYGSIKVGGKTAQAHHVSWEFEYGPIPDGLWVLHHCDNPGCVNPDHLFLGDHQANMDDMMAKGRDNKARGEDNGNAILTEEKIRKIRVWLARGKPTQQEIAEMCGVNYRTISAINIGATWGWLKNR